MNKNNNLWAGPRSCPVCQEDQGEEREAGHHRVSGEHRAGEGGGVDSCGDEKWLQDQYKIDKKLLADYKELFALFDKVRDVIKREVGNNETVFRIRTASCPSQRWPQPSGLWDREYQVTTSSVSWEYFFRLEKELLAMVRQVSEDKTFDSLEFNEFLTMLGRQNIEDIKFESLVEAFG